MPGVSRAELQGAPGIADDRLNDKGRDRIGRAPFQV